MFYYNYLDDEVFKEFFVLIHVFGLFSDDDNFGVFVKFLDKSVDSGHALNADLVLISTELNFKLDIILCEFCLVIIKNSLFFSCDVLRLFSCTLFLTLL